MDDEDKMLQLPWLEKVLAENTKKWTAIVMHQPIWDYELLKSLGISDSLLSQYSLQLKLRPLLEKHNVDIVQGHYHYYGRGQKVPSAPINMELKSNTMYVTSSVTSAVRYVREEKNWMDRLGDHMQMYSLITIDGNTLKFDAYTATGKRYDGFDLVKQKNGKPNKVINRIPDRLKHVRPK